MRGFYLSVLWATVTALFLHRTYQDAWMLADLWLPLFVVLALYLASAWLSTSLGQVATLSSIATFVLHGVPAIKYSNVYLSTIDNTVHVSLIRMLASTGHVERESSYASTPGFHALTAALAVASGFAPQSLAQVVPSFLGSIMPLALYTLCKHFNFPAQLSKCILIVAAFSLPALYTLSGTNFVLPLIVALITMFFITPRGTGSVQEILYRLVPFLLIVTVTLWHPATSFLFPGILVLVGFVSSRLYRGAMLPTLSSSFVIVGIVGIVATLAFWMFSADFVWSRFALNVITALSVDSKVQLIPTRLFELGLQYQLLIAAFNHARDLAIVGLAMIGVAFLTFTRRSTELAQVFRTYALIWAAFVGLLVAVFVVSFGDQGYVRFLGYVVGLSPMLAGYGLWRMVEVLRRSFHIRRTGVVAAAITGVVALMFSIQLYPYQPAIPTLKGENQQNAPIVWLHQVNSTYQHHLLNYAIERLMPTLSPDQTQILADYIGYQQGALYHNIRSKLQMRRSINQQRLPAYILLHWPGRAGAFMEQAEYRSTAAIARWYSDPAMSVVYDNGESFILYSPANAEEPFYLERPAP